MMFVPDTEMQFRLIHHKAFGWVLDEGTIQMLKDKGVDIWSGGDAILNMLTMLDDIVGNPRKV